ncbi:MAG: hypothetical protein ABW032_02635 [Burkholderiaceae bacterium]
MRTFEQLAVARLRMQAWLWTRREQSRQRPTAARPFPAGARRKLLLVSLPGAIPQSQIFPFHFYRGTLRGRWGYELREIGLQSLIDDPGGAPRDADLVFFQSWIDKTPMQLKEIVGLIRRENPRATLVFLDPCAPADLRFAASIGSDVDFYVKKHVLRDRGAYARPTRGDTNLSDWYGAHYGEDLPQVHFAPPEGFMDKLVVGPSFVTAPYMLPRFAAASAAPGAAGRTYDLHARLGGMGQRDWYEKMRSDAFAQVARLAGKAVTPQTMIGKRAYLRELGRSKICFSPFGYGEVCWRDYEAVYCGTALLKPDMSHIETFPDVFIAGETYLPLRWDFTDLGGAVDHLLSREALRRELVANTYEIVHRFARGTAFVDGLERIFAAAA